jgi:small subunit ribosomal protein S24e
MEATISAVKNNPLLDRREVTVKLEHDGEATPSFDDVKSRIAAEKGLDEESIEVDTVKTGYGRNDSVAKLKIFEDFDYDEELEEDAIEEEVEVTEEYREIVSGTITEAKDALGEMEDPDWKAVLQAEKDNKNRTTLVDWLESQM